MSWLPSGTIRRLKEKAMALTPAERAALTWEDANYFVAHDTLDMATWSGIKRRPDITPWEAICALRGIK